MFRFVVLSFTLVAFIPAEILAGRIIGGVNIDIAQVPYQVAVFQIDLMGIISFVCGGSIIRENVILTAAYCINQNLNMFIRYGSNHINGGKRINVIHKVPHKDFNPGTFANDIGLMFLEEKILCDKYAKLISLPNITESTPTNTMALATGWGLTSVSGTVAENLQAIILPILSQEICETIFDTFYPIGMICAGHVSQYSVLCIGDTGDPLVVNGIQYGVLSGAGQYCDLKTPAVFTKVVNYREWIDSKLNSAVQQNL